MGFQQFAIIEPINNLILYIYMFVGIYEFLCMTIEDFNIDN